MRLFTLLTVTATLLGAVSAASLAVIRESECAHEEIVHTTYIGQDKNVKFQVSRCDDEALTDPNGGLPTSLTKRQTASACGILCAYTISSQSWLRATCADLERTACATQVPAFASRR